MRETQIVISVAALVVLTGHSPSRTSPGGDELEGTWVVRSAIRNGREHAKGRRDTWAIGPGKITLTTRVDGLAEKSESFAFESDEEAMPRSIDVVVSEGQVFRGIYELTGGTLRVCLTDDPNDDRPTEFKATKQWQLIVLERADR